MFLITSTGKQRVAIAGGRPLIFFPYLYESAVLLQAFLITGPLMALIMDCY